MTTEHQKLICVMCPKGCTLEVDREGNAVLSVIGGCKRGHDYAHQEMVDPRRKVASSVRIEGAIHPLLPVYTSAAFPKALIPKLLLLLRSVQISAPVTTNQVILANVLDTGIDILASREMRDLGTP